MGLLSGYRPLARRIGSFRLSGNGKRRTQVTRTLSTLSTNQLLVSDAGSQADDSLRSQKKDDHGESHSGGESRTGSSRPRNQEVVMDGKKGGGAAGEAPAESGSTKEEKRIRSTGRGEEGNLSALSSSSLSSGDRRKEEESEDKEIERQLRLVGADCPGSPSFREYCHISISDADDSGEDGDYRLTDDESSHERKEGIGSCKMQTIISVEPPMHDQTKKLPPVAKDWFKRLGLLTRAPIAMLNMRSCYRHSSSSSSQDSPRLVAIKSATQPAQ